MQPGNRRRVMNDFICRVRPTRICRDQNNRHTFDICVRLCANVENPVVLKKVIRFAVVCAREIPPSPRQIETTRLRFANRKNINIYTQHKILSRANRSMYNRRTVKHITLHSANHSFENSQKNKQNNNQKTSVLLSNNSTWF